MTKKTIVANMKIQEILEIAGEKAIPILLKAGMHCFGCPMSRMETLEQGCLAHGLNKKEIESIVKELNSLMKVK